MPEAEKPGPIRCRFNYCIYDAATKGEESGYMVCVYKIISAPPGCPYGEGEKFTATGYFLSQMKNAEILLLGDWKKDRKRGGKLQLAVTECSEEIEKTRYGIVEFLSSGLIKGVGKKMAERIYGKFGPGTLDIMDNHIERLKEISGIGDKKLKKIEKSYKGISGSREMVTFLGRYGIPPRLSQAAVHKGITPAMVKDNPYILLGINGVGFPSADGISISLGLDMRSKDRVTAGIIHCLKKNEAAGNTGMAKGEMVKQAIKLLNAPAGDYKRATADLVEWYAEKLVGDKELVAYGGFVYRHAIYYAECDIAKDIARLSRPVEPSADLNKKIGEWEKENGKTLDDIQKKAVTTALSSGFCVVTGGPGRGKTMITKAVIDIRKSYGKTVRLMAPTGRAARRLSESTGEGASTIHSTLGLGLQGGEEETKVKIDEGQVIVDEVSMLDTWLAKSLFNAVSSGSSVMLLGDVDQLPSVGTGAVLRDIIDSGSVPVVTLEKIYRQAEGSTILDNCEKIRKGEPDLAKDSEFRCYKAEDGKEAAKCMAYLYKQKCNEYGPDEVALLSPFHHAQSETSSDRLNRCLQEALNPASADKGEVKSRNKVFREGDRVMQIKNADGFCNGDIGTIESISKDEDGDTTVAVRFQDGKIRPYGAPELDLLELAYCMTYHKAQGSEYKCVIGCLLDEHRAMLKRNLIYTGVSRAKTEFDFVGSPVALKKSIATVDTQQRNTLLKRKIIYALSKK